jgi:Ca2+-binding EF-hand superfamily protein
LYRGSPRDLLINNLSDPDWLEETPNSSITMKVYSHRKLLRLQRLLAENEIVGKFDVIPGLESKIVAPAGTTRSCDIACIGDEEVVNSKTHAVFCIPTNPHIILPQFLDIQDFDVFIPSREKFEQRVMAGVVRNLSDYDRVDATITARTLRIGLHNGHAVVGGDLARYNLSPDDDEDILLAQNAIQVRGYAAHELMALVVMLEYEVSTPHRSDSKYDNKKMKATLSNLREENMITHVVLGCAVHVPFDGNKVNTTNAAGVDCVKLRLFNDDTCAILSPNPVFVDPTASKSSKGDEGKDDSDNEDELDTFMNVSFVLGVNDPVSGRSGGADDDSVRGGVELDEDVRPNEADDGSELGEATRTRDSRQSQRRSTDRERTSAMDRDRDRDLGRGSTRGTTGPFRQHDDDDADDDIPAQNLDSTYYETRKSHDRGYPPDVEASIDGESSLGAYSPPRARGGAGRGHLGEPSLYSRALTAPVFPGGAPGVELRGSREGFDNFDRYDGTGRRVGVPAQPPLFAPAPVMAGNREISRGARARLDRHGFNQAMLTDDDASPAAIPGAYKSSTLNTRGSIGNARVDVNLEAQDSNAVNDVTLQFAAFRHSNKTQPASRPTCIYFSYQFYTAAPTRTELLKLLSPDDGRLCVLARDDSFHRNEPPLALRHVVDCSEGSSIEVLEFAEYLAHKVLYVDVWDSDSLIMLGTCAVPLRDIMRQGSPSVRRAIECDVVSVDLGSNGDAGHSSGSVVYSGGLLQGEVVGSVQIILCNHGKRGGALPRAGAVTKSTGEGNEIDLNWRINPADPAAAGESSATLHGRPRHATRARPLAERAPELSDAITRHRRYARNDDVARSLGSARGTENANTITYDEIITLFKKFEGNVAGTIRYNGELMSLLEVPTMGNLMRKLLSAFAAEQQVFQDELLKASTSNDPKKATIAPVDFQNALQSFFQRCGVKIKPEEVGILVQHISKNCNTGTAAAAGSGKDISVGESVAFCVAEKKRLDWTSTGKRFQNAVKDCYLIGFDIEQALSEYDVDAKDVITVPEFREVLKGVSKLSKLSSRDITLVCEHFTARTGQGSGVVVALKEVMMFIGKAYVGNVEARLKHALMEKYSEAELLSALGRTQMTAAEVEAKLGTLAVFEVLSHEQVRQILSRALQVRPEGTIDGPGFLQHIRVSAAGALGGKDSVETLLRGILELVQAKGVAIDEAFRHFDTDGDGTISHSEFERGLSQLEGFDSIPNWREQIPSIVSKFDKGGDGTVQLREFFLYFGITEYAPNVIQRMTKIFLVAHEKGMSFRSIFQEFDSDGDGILSAKELVAALEALQTFEPIAIEDAEEVISHLHPEGTASTEIARDKFIAFFDARLKEKEQSKREQKKSRGLKPAAGAPAAAAAAPAARKPALSAEMKIKSVIRKAVASNLSIEELFAKGDLKLSEMRAVLEAMSSKHDGDLSADEIATFVSSMDTRDRGTISEATFRVCVDVQEGQDSLYESTDSPEVLLFRKEVRRVARAYDSVTALLASLDRDGSNVISLLSFLKMLESEGAFGGGGRGGESKGGDAGDVLTRDMVERVLDPITRKGDISVSSLLQLMEGKRVTPGGSLAADADDDALDLDVVEAIDYKFDKDPYVNALEKKLRRVARILSKRGVHVEHMFTSADRTRSGLVRRTEFIEILSKLGLSLLEDTDNVGSFEDPKQLKQQIAQVNRIKGSTYADNAGKYARSASASNDGDPTFDDHLESMALINWYRQSQKKNMLQRVLSKSLVSTVDIHPRFGKTVFFEKPFTNPYGHEERFVIELNDPELRLVTNFDEWLHLRASVSPSGGKLGPEPVEPEVFDKDTYGNVEVALLPHETLYIPFTFMTLVPHHKTISLAGGQPAIDQDGESKSSDGGSRKKNVRPHRVATVSIVSGSRGHATSIINVSIFPSPFTINRTLRFLEAENSMMKRRIQFVDSGAKSGRDGGAQPVKYVHCVDHDGHSSQNNLVVEWSSSPLNSGNLDMILRYRCGSFPSFGSFYILLYDDQYHSKLHEMWHVVIQYRQRLDVHGPIGSSSVIDLVVRGDQFPRRARAFISHSVDNVSIAPNVGFQLTPGAYNRLAVKFVPRGLGTRKLQLNLVDTDSRELISAWLLTTTATAPPVMRSYNVEMGAGKVINKKIMFRNPWDTTRKFALSSSNPEVMRPRVENVDVSPHSDCYLRLLFDAKKMASNGATEDVFLFLNDEYSGQNEECFLFRVSCI